MTTYEKCQAVRRAIVNRAAEVMNYTNWSDELAATQIREIPEVLAEKIGKINIAELTPPQMDDLGFGQWSEENQMRLIPLWLFKFLPDEIESECIDGTKSVLKTAEMDNDHRFGCLAYGIWPNVLGPLSAAMKRKRKAYASVRDLVKATAADDGQVREFDRRIKGAQNVKVHTSLPATAGKVEPLTIMNTITSRITVLPKGESIFSQLATEISIVDEAAGPFIEMRQFPDEGDEKNLRFDLDEWPYIAKAVGKLIQEIEKLKQ